MRRSDVILLTMLALLPFAGCLDASDGPGSDPAGDGGAQGSGSGAGDQAATQGQTMLGGAFTEAATQADIQEAGALARQEGAELLVMESYPAQFQARGMDASGCERLRAALQAKAYVARVGECQPVTQSADPDEPVSHAPSSAASGKWGFGGSFTVEHTDDDVRAVCKAGTGNESCPIMKSAPPQYTFTFASEQECKEARQRVLAVPHVADVRECVPLPQG